jgi:hypothetical protein
MSISKREALVTESREVIARVWDGSARGLTIGHLRAFVEQADVADLKDETTVWLDNKLQPSSSWHTVEIRASERVSDTKPVARAAEEEST